MALIARLKMWLYAAGAVVIAMGAAYLRGRRDESNGHLQGELNEYVQTRKRMDEADDPSDSDVERWLHERGKHQRDL